MPIIQPGLGDVHVDVPLSNVSLAFIQNADNFVASRIFPIINSPAKSNQYFTYDRDFFLRDLMQERAPGASAVELSYAVGTQSFNCRVYAAKRAIDDQIRGNADAAIDLDREATELLTSQALINREVNWASNYFGSGIWATDLTGVAASNPTPSQFQRWDRDASTPIEDVRTAMRTVQESTAHKPNVAVVGKHVYDALLDHPDIIARLDRGQTTGPAIVQRQNLAALFELEEIMVMEAVRTTSVEGASTPVRSYIGGNNFLLAHRAPSPGLMTASAGYTFIWTGLMGAGSGTVIKRYREEKVASDIIEIHQAYDQHLVAADLGYMFLDAVS